MSTAAHEAAPREAAPAGTAPAVTVYTTPRCTACAAVTRFLAARGVPFVERDVAADPAARDEMRRVAQVRIAPVTVVGGRAFYGTFEDQRPHLEAALGLRGAEPDRQTPPAGPTTRVPPTD